MNEIEEIRQLREFYEQSAYSLERLAVEIGVHSQAVRKWFRGARPHNLTMQAIRRFLKSKGLQ